MDELQWTIDWCCGFCLFTAQPWITCTPAVQQSDKNWPPSCTVVFPRSPSLSIKAHVWEKPGGIYPAGREYQKPLYCLGGSGGAWGRGGSAWDLIRPIMINHNQKSILSNPLLEKRQRYWGWQICFLRNGLCVYENNIRPPASQPCAHTLGFFPLRSIYHSVQLIIKLFLFLPRHTLLFFNCMKYSLFRQIRRQSLINC